MSKFYIYSLSSSENPELVRYIGQTSTSLNRRLIGHLSKAKVEANHRACWIRSELALGNTICITQIDEANEFTWMQKEKEYIKLYRSFGAKLVNATEGGEAPMLNKRHSKETIEKLRICRALQTRKPHSESTKQKLREATTNQMQTKGHPLKGKACSEERKERIRQGVLRYYANK